MLAPESTQSPAQEVDLNAFAVGARKRDELQNAVVLDRNSVTRKTELVELRVVKKTSRTTAPVR